MTSLPNRHSSASMPERSRTVFRTQRRTGHRPIFSTVHVPHRCEPGNRYGAVT